MQEAILVFVAFIIFAYGYVLYAREIYIQETKDFSILPWLIFFVLALSDFLNILLSEEVNIVEIIAGGAIFLGPFCISCLIIYGGMKKYNRSLQEQFLQEWNANSSESIFFLAGSLSVLLLIFSEYIGWATSFTIELAFVCVAISFDVLSTKILIHEMREDSQKHKTAPWFLWIVAGVLIYLANYPVLFSIGSILILENTLITLFIFWKLWGYQRGEKSIW